MFPLQLVQRAWHVQYSNPNVSSSRTFDTLGGMYTSAEGYRAVIFPIESLSSIIVPLAVAQTCAHHLVGMHGPLELCRRLTHVSRTTCFSLHCKRWSTVSMFFGCNIISDVESCTNKCRNGNLASGREHTWDSHGKPPNRCAHTRCTCFEGWGADTDLTLYRSADCSARVCPAGKAWGDVPSGPLSAHEEQECSSRYAHDWGS